MLHYCTIEEISGGIQVAPRFEADLLRVRDSVTRKINNYIRRNLEYRVGFEEFFDAPDLGSGRPVSIWLEKKNITDLTVAYSQTRQWDDNYLEEERVVLDAENGKVTVYGYLRQWPRALRIVYNGGYPAKVDDAEVMECPLGLSFAATQQCIFDAAKAINGDQGVQTDDDKKTPVRMRAGLLLDVADTFTPYRRPLGR